MGFNPLCNAKINRILRDGGAGYSSGKKLSTAIQDTTFAVNYSDFEAAGVPAIEVKTDFVPTDGQKIVIHEYYGTVLVNKYECVCEKITGEGETALALGGLVEMYAHGVAPENVKCPWGIAWADGLCSAAYVKEDIIEAPYVPKFGALLFFAETETIHPIDPKFIPGAVLPVVELGTVATLGRSTQITNADDIAKLNSLGDTPCILKLKVIIEDLELPCSFPMACAYLDGTAVYSGVFVFNGMHPFAVTNDGVDGWYIITGEG